MINKNLDHERALYAFKCVETIGKLHDDLKEKKYRSAVLSSGILIHKSGLMQTLSFYISKKDEHYQKLAAHILNWREICGGNDEPLAAYQKLLNLPDDEIIQKTQEAKALILWLKNFADAMLKKET